MEQIHGTSNNLVRQKRNIKERGRRIHMKYLIDRLAPIVHPNHPDPYKLSVLEVADQAVNYVKKLRKHVKMLKKYKQQKSKEDTSSSLSRVPAIDIRSIDDSIVELNLVTGLKANFMSYEIIQILQEEYTQVLSYSRHTTSDSVIYTIRAQAISVRIGMDISRIHERVNELIHCSGIFNLH